MVQLNAEIDEQTNQAHQKGEEIANLMVQKKELEVERENLLEEVYSPLFNAK